MKSKVLTRSLTLLLTFVLCVGMLPTAALAEYADPVVPPDVFSEFSEETILPEEEPEQSGAEADWTFQKGNTTEDVTPQAGWITATENGVTIDHAKMIEDTKVTDWVVFNNKAEPYRNSTLEYDITFTNPADGDWVAVAPATRVTDGKNYEGFAMEKGASLQRTGRKNGGENYGGVTNQAGVKFEYGKTYHLRMVTMENRITVYVTVPDGVEQKLTEFNSPIGLSAGTYGFRIWRNSKTITIENIVRTEFVASSIEKSTVSIEADDWGKNNVTIPVSFGKGDSVRSIMNGGAALTDTTDYTVDEDGITLKMEYIAKQTATFELTVNFTGGSSGEITVEVYDRGKLPTLANMERAILQRDADDIGILNVVGYEAHGVSDLQVRAVLAQDAMRGEETEWTDATKVTEGLFDIVLPISAGGWYSVEARIIDGEDTAQDEQTLIEKIGVGDVFLVSGQSNSACYGSVKTKAQADTVSSMDAKNGLWYHCKDPQPSNSDANGTGGSAWPTAGDVLVEALQVPIGFVLTGRGGAYIDQYKPTGTQYYKYIRGAIQRLEATGGFKAVLWHQGESDSYRGTSTSSYLQTLQAIINVSRADAGFAVPWIVANASFHSHKDATEARQEAVRLAQRKACDDRTVFLGPDTDSLGEEFRSGGEHFNAEGLKLHGNMWAECILTKLYNPQPEPENLAQNKTAMQSSTSDSAEAALAVDGNGNTASETMDEKDAWWQVDLGSTQPIGEIILMKQDQNADYSVMVLDEKQNVIWECRQLIASDGAVALQTAGFPGRYIRIRLNGSGSLRLADIKVFQAENLALYKSASQSSTTLNCGPELAVDGNTDGEYSHMSLTHTDSDNNAWWQVDLGDTYPISYIQIFNRTGAAVERLSNYTVSILDADRNSVWSTVQKDYPEPSIVLVAAGVEGRYVKIQLNSKNNLSLAEVQVFESPQPQYLQSEVVVTQATNSSDDSAKEYLTDSDRNTWWYTSEMGEANTTIELDLQHIYGLQELRITPQQYKGVDIAHNDRPGKLNLYVSSDGTIWLKALENAEIQYADYNDNSCKTIQLAGVQARYLRLEVWEPTGSHTDGEGPYEKISIAEIDVVPVGTSMASSDLNRGTIEELKAYLQNGEPLSGENSYFKTRGSLSNSYLKLNNSESTTVAFVGGSITSMKGWKELTMSFLENSFPENNNIAFIDAGISSHDSTAHAFRAEKDIFSKGKVDLLFLEAAVNDEWNGRTGEESQLAFEGFIRQAYENNPNMDIVILYFVDDKKIAEYEETQSSHVITAQDTIAEEYDIPAIDLSQHVIESMNRGEFTWKTFGGLHPAAFGHKIYATRIAEFLTAYWETTDASTDVIDKSESLPEQLMHDNAYTHGKLYDVGTLTEDEVYDCEGFTRVEKWNPNDGYSVGGGDYKNRPMLCASNPGAHLTYTFKGTTVGVFVMSGPKSGKIEYSIDGGAPKVRDLYTDYGSASLHLPWPHILENNLTDGAHTITITLLEETRSGGHACNIRYFIVNEGSAQQPETSATPEITAQPMDRTVAEGAPASFAVAASASDGGTLSYQWQNLDKGQTNAWTDIDGATDLSYTAPDVTKNDSGAQFRCVVTNTKGSLAPAFAMSDVATLTVNAGEDGLLTIWDNTAVTDKYADEGWKWENNVLTLKDVNGDTADTVKRVCFTGSVTGATLKLDSNVALSGISGQDTIASSAPAGLTINTGSHTLTVTADGAGSAIVSRSSYGLKITGGTVTANSNHFVTISSAGPLTISGGAHVTAANTGGAGISANVGGIAISGGSTVTATGNSDGFAVGSQGDVSIDNSTVTATNNGSGPAILANVTYDQNNLQVGGAPTLTSAHVAWAGADAVTAGSAYDPVQINTYKYLEIVPDTQGGDDSSSGGGGSTTPSTPTVTPPPADQPNAPTNAETRVEAKADTNGTATVTVPEQSVTDAIKAAQDAAKKNGTEKNGISVTIDATTSKGASAITATLPEKSVDALIQAGVTEVQINSDAASISLNLAALKAAQDAAGGAVTLSAKPMNVSTLSAAAQAAIGSRPVFQLSLTSGGKAVSDFEGGAASVTLPYTLGADEKAGDLCGVYVDDDGKVTFLPGSSYDDKAKTLTFATTHFSVFGIGAKAPNPFTDVSDSAYYYDAVRWAVEQGVTSGTSATTFSPDASCTRAQMVTFLWNAMGKPEPDGAVNPFTDVSADAYYYKAALWAVDKGITTGTSAATFSPDTAVTRSQIVTLLWRAAGSPAVTGSSFGDVDGSAYYAQAVIWAVSENITTGTGGGNFSPNADCTRAQIVTFLYRAFAD